MISLPQVSHLFSLPLIGQAVSFMTTVRHSADYKPNYNNFYFILTSPFQSLSLWNLLRVLRGVPLSATGTGAQSMIWCSVGALPETFCYSTKGIETFIETYSTRVFSLWHLRWGPGRILQGVRGTPLPAPCEVWLYVRETRQHWFIKKKKEKKKRHPALQNLLMEPTHIVCLAKIYSWTLGLLKLDLSGYIGCIHEVWVLMSAYRDWRGCNQLYSWTLCLSVGAAYMLNALTVLNQLLRWWGRAPGGLCGWLGSSPRWCDGVQEQ